MTAFNNFRDTIRVIGFDLDQTLYPKSPEVDTAIQEYILEKIAEHKNIALKEANRLFSDLYQSGKGLSGSQTVTALGVPNGKEIIQEALERANIIETLRPDQRVIDLLHDLGCRYAGVDLLTGSNRSNAEEKLRTLGIPNQYFAHSITADDALKSDGSAYRQWMSCYNFYPEQFLYVGDRVMSDYEIPKKLGIKGILVNIQFPDTSLDAPQLSSILDLRSVL